MNNGYYPFSMRQGSKLDFAGAWLSRILQTVFAAAILWVCKLILAAVMYLVNTLPPMQRDVSELKRDVSELKLAQAASKQEIQTAAGQAKQELIDAERRVKNEFTKLLNEQLKKKGRITTPGEHNPD